MFAAPKTTTETPETTVSDQKISETPLLPMEITLTNDKLVVLISIEIRKDVRPKQLEAYSAFVGIFKEELGKAFSWSTTETISNRQITFSAVQNKTNADQKVEHSPISIEEFRTHVDKILSKAKDKKIISEEMYAKVLKDGKAKNVDKEFPSLFIHQGPPLPKPKNTAGSGPTKRL
jgi:hypothetical protein